MIHTASDQQEKPFRIVAIYDSALTSVEAARASAIVCRELGDDVPVNRSSWDLEDLNRSTVCAFAATEAARADMIVIALGSSEPSAALQSWVQLWERKRVLNGGLLALIPAGEAKDELEHYFYETAVTAHMDFLCGKSSRYQSDHAV